MPPVLTLIHAIVQAASVWAAEPPLPAPVANNAVAAVSMPAGWAVFSLLGLDSTKRWDGRVSAAYRLDAGSARWRPVSAVPGEGRLASTAQAVNGKLYVFGGYTVARDGAERSVPEVDVYDPAADRWSAGAPMPVPVDDAVSGVWRDSLVYLVSGWHDRDNVNLVQIYDPALDRWTEATPIPGPPVFGHAGGVSGNTIIYVDGVRVDREPRRFALEGSSWAGEIDPADPARIRWRRLAPHPGPPLYRAAAVGVEGFVVFAGGSDNPYNYDGTGYDGEPSEPRSAVFAFEIARDRWAELTPLPVATMDHRQIARAGGRLFIVGGMTAGQTVTGRVESADLAELLAELERP